MANVIKTVLTYPLDGTTRDYSIPFEYLARKFVVVTLIGVDRKVLTLTTDYRFATRTTISLNRAWGQADGYTQIELRRVTSATERLVDFTDGSILRAYDLNVAQIQTMHVAEEARDLTADTIGVNNEGHLDARGRRIVNLADAQNDGDAISLGQVKRMSQSAWQARNEALGFRNEAEQFRDQAEVSKNIAVAAQNSALDSKQHAAQSADAAGFHHTQASQFAQAAAQSNQEAHQAEQSASTSANTAGNFADESKRQADRAKTEADKLANLNTFAAALKEVTPSRVTFNRETTTWNSGLRSMTDRNTAPYAGAWREGIGEVNLSVDGHGNKGIIGAVGSSFLKYWNPEGNTEVCNVSYHVVNGESHVKGSQIVGHGRNSSIVTYSAGEGNAGGWVSSTQWKWYNGAVEVGAVRGSGTDAQGLYRTRTGHTNQQIDYWQNPVTSQHRFLNNAGQEALVIHSNGDISMQWCGLLSTFLNTKTPKRWSWIHLGNMPVSNDAVMGMPIDVRGLRGFFGFVGERGDTVYKPFQFPPLDCRFQLNRKGDWQVFELTNGGTTLIRRYGWSEGGDAYVFYAEQV